MQRRVLFILLSIIVSIVLIYFVLRDIPLADVWESIRQADILWLILSFVFVTAALFTRGERWRGLLGFRIPRIASLHLVNIAFLVNLLPLRVGEVVRSALATRYDVPFMTGLTSVVVERLVDSLVALLLLAFAISQVPDVDPTITRTAMFFGVAAIFGFIVLLIFAHRPNLAHTLLNFFNRILPILERLPLRRLLDHVLDGLQPLTQWNQFAHFMIWTGIAWSMSLISFYCLFRALPVGDVDLMVGVPLAISLSSFSIALPATIAAIGPFEVAILATGEVIGMTEIMSVALGFLTHGMAVLGYIVWGVVGLLALGVSPAEMMKTKREEDMVSSNQVG